jgi:hypothetical protein
MRRRLIAGSCSFPEPAQNVSAQAPELAHRVTSCPDDPSFEIVATMRLICSGSRMNFTSMKSCVRQGLSKGAEGSGRIQESDASPVHPAAADPEVDAWQMMIHSHSTSCGSCTLRIN